MCGFLDLSDHLTIRLGELPEQIVSLPSKWSRRLVGTFKDTHVQNGVSAGAWTPMPKEQQVHRALFEFLAIVDHFTYGHTVPNNLAPICEQHKRSLNWHSARQYPNRLYFKFSDDSRVGCIDIAFEAREPGLENQVCPFREFINRERYRLTKHADDHWGAGFSRNVMDSIRNRLSGRTGIVQSEAETEHCRKH